MFNGRRWSNDDKENHLRFFFYINCLPFVFVYFVSHKHKSCVFQENKRLVSSYFILLHTQTHTHDTSGIIPQ